MATQRLNPINIDYQVPADVAGFAGQRAAVSEAEAISQNQSRKMAETQDIVKANLAAQDTFARIKHNEMQMELEKQKAAHTVKIQNAELDHQMNIDWNKMQNEWDLLPLEMRRLELANEAQDIENEWAADEKEAELEGTELENAAKRKQLEDSKNLGAYERSKREWVKGGGAPKDFVWGGPAFTTPQGLQGQKAIDARMNQESAAVRNQKEADEYNGIYDELTEAQQDAIDDATDALVKGNVGISPFGGKRTFFNANGNGFSEKGQDVLRRLEKQTAIKLTHAEKAHLKASTDATEKSWFEKIGNSDSIVLTEAGLRQYEGRREAVKTMWRAVERSVIDGKETIKYERRSEAVQEAVDRAVDAHYKSDAYLLQGKEPDLDAIKTTAIEQKGFDVNDMARDTVISRMESGDTLYIRTPDGGVEMIDPSRVSAGPDGVRGTADDVIAGAGNAPPPPDTSSSTELATSMSSSEDKHTKEGEVQLLGYDNMTPDGLTTDGGGGYNTTDFNNGNLPRIGKIMDRLQLSADKVDPLVADTYEGKGYGATLEEAKEIADLLKQRYIDPAGSEGGSDERFVSERESVNTAVDYYSDKHVNPHRVKLAKLLGLNWKNDPVAEGWSLPFGLGSGPPQFVNRTSDREAHEIISTEVGDSTVRLKGGKVMTIREFVKLPAHEMLGARLFIPYAYEEKSEGYTPNAPTEGNIHDPNRRRFYGDNKVQTESGKRQMTMNVTLFPHHFKDDIGAIKTTLTQLIENGDHLTKLGDKFLRYKLGEYD